MTEDNNNRLCDHCHAAPAQVIIKIIENGTVHELNLCRNCAEKMQKNPMREVPQLANIFEEIMKQSGIDFEKLADLPFLSDLLPDGGKKKTEPRCPKCHHSLKNILDNHLLFCKECWSTFKKQLAETFFSKMPIDNFASSLPNITPTGIVLSAEPQLRLQEAVDTLNEQLSDAIREERYRDASRYQKELRLAEKRLQQSFASGLPPIRNEKERTEDFCRKSLAFHNLEKCTHPVRRPFFPQTLPPPGKPLIRLRSYAMLCRNIAGMDLPPYSNCDMAIPKKITQDFLDFLSEDYFTKLFLHPEIFCPSTCNAEQKRLLVFCGIAQREFLDRPLTNATALVYSKDRRVILKTGNTDHLQLTLWAPSENLADAVELYSGISSRLASKFTFDYCEHGLFSRNLCAMGGGYSVGQYLHLPALAITNEIEQITHACEKFGLLLQPVYGTNTPDEQCYIYRLKNAFNLTVPINAMAQILMKAVRRIERCELECRTGLLMDPIRSSNLYDGIGRAAGVMRGANELTVNEARHILSMLWLGVETGSLKNLDLHRILDEFSACFTQKELIKTSDPMLKEITRVNRDQGLARILRYDLCNKK